MCIGIGLMLCVNMFLIDAIQIGLGLIHVFVKEQRQFILYRL